MKTTTFQLTFPAFNLEAIGPPGDPTICLQGAVSLGSGMFHATAIRVCTGKPTIGLKCPYCNGAVLPDDGDPNAFYCQDADCPGNGELYDRSDLEYEADGEPKQQPDYLENVEYGYWDDLVKRIVAIAELADANDLVTMQIDGKPYVVWVEPGEV